MQLQNILTKQVQQTRTISSNEIIGYARTVYLIPLLCVFSLTPLRKNLYSLAPRHIPFEENHVTLSVRNKEKRKKNLLIRISLSFLMEMETETQGIGGSVKQYFMNTIKQPTS